jgi:hypothetical protein
MPPGRAPCSSSPTRTRQASRLALGGLRVGDARVDLVFERVARRPDSVSLTELEINGDVVREAAGLTT